MVYLRLFCIITSWSIVSTISAEQHTVHVGYIAIHDDILTRYEDHVVTLMTYADNPSIDYIVLDINCPGGFANISEIITDTIRTIRIKKPVLAFITDLGASASYRIAASASYIIAPKTALIGSIGSLVSFAQHHEKRTHVLTSGIYLAPFAPDSDQGLGELYKQHRQEQSTMRAFDFFEHVHRERNITVEALKNLEAHLFMAEQALYHGLIDEIGTWSAVIKKISQDMALKYSRQYTKLVLLDKDNKEIMAFLNERII